MTIAIFLQIILFILSMYLGWKLSEWIENKLFNNDKHTKN